MFTSQLFKDITDFRHYLCHLHFKSPPPPYDTNTVTKEGVWYCLIQIPLQSVRHCMTPERTKTQIKRCLNVELCSFHSQEKKLSEKKKERTVFIKIITKLPDSIGKTSSNSFQMS